MRTIILLMIFLSAFAWSNIGNIGAVQGDATIKRAAKDLEVKSGMDIQLSDKVSTQENSRVQAILNDDTIVTIGPNSVFVFDTYQFGDKDTSAVNMHIERGFFRSVTGQIGKIAPQRFKIKTNSTTIGIRGTDFSGIVMENKEIITCLRGKIWVAVDVKTYELNIGEQLIVLKGKKGGKDASSSEVISSENAQYFNSADEVPADYGTASLQADSASQFDALKSFTTPSSISNIEDRISDMTQENEQSFFSPTVEFPDR